MKMKARNNFLTILVIIIGVFFMSCATGKDSGTDWEQLEQYDSFISGGRLAETVYVMDPPDQMDEILVAQAIQGIVSRTNVQIYIIFGENYRKWLNESRSKFKFRMAGTSVWELADKFKDQFKGYVIYDATDSESMNYAATLAGALDALPVTPGLAGRMKQLGLSQLDAASNYDDIQQMITKYGDKLNKKIFINQSPALRTLRDYGIKNRCIIAHPSDNLDAVYNFLDDNALLLGWHDDEVSGVNEASKKQVITIASDHAYNLSFFSAFSMYDHKQKEPVDKHLTGQNGKHYIAFAYSDGDNIQWLINSGAIDQTRFAYSKGMKIPFGWSIAPTLADFAPIVMDYMYRKAALTDNFIAAVSGYGYIHPSEYYNTGKMDALKEFTKLTAEYMRRTDMHYTEILDELVNEPIIETLDAYTENDQIAGILWKSGNRYVGGKGLLRWSNGKPVVAIRESLWSNQKNDNRDIYQMAFRITQYDKDPTTIDGYTLINVHAWSHDFSSIEKMVRWLKKNDPNVIVVTPDTFMRLISENVPKIDANPQQNWNDGYDYPSSLY